LATDMFPIRRPDHVEQLLPADALPEILPQLDVLILCVPLNAQTEGMIGQHTFSAMPRGSILINVARGPVVVESELVEALQSGQLGGAGLDVTEVEPLPIDSPLWDMPQVLITPHVGAQSLRRADVTTKFLAANLSRYVLGRPLRNVVDKSLGYPRPEEREIAE
ncbi:MAG: hypothetical protein RIS70_69, partial [Planctomycetota bacterium]